MRAIDELEVGGVMINDIPTFRVDHMPYGGVKESGTGREGIKYAIEEMTEMKLVCIKNKLEKLKLCAKKRVGNVYDSILVFTLLVTI